MYIIDNFKLSSKKFLDDRQYWESLIALKGNSTILMPKGFLVYCKAEDKWYKMSCTDESNPSTYTWTESINSNRKFKPNLLTYIWTQNTVDSNGLRTVSIETNKLDVWLKQIKESGIDGIEICQHIAFNESTRELYYMTNLETIDYTINKCKELGLKTPLLKVHQKFNLDQVKFLFGNTKTKEENMYDIEAQTISIAQFKENYKTMIKQMCERYKDDIEYMPCFNENQHYWDREILPKTQDTSATDTTQIPSPLYEADFPAFVVELINMIQSYGIKSGVSTAGIKDLNALNTSIWATFDSVDKRILDTCECFFINLYPPVSSKGSNTTYEECISGIKSNLVWNKIKQLQREYNKEIFITETGCMDLWDSLYSPGNWAWTGTTQNGKVQAMYLEALLEAFSNAYGIKNIAWWYTDCFTDNYKQMQPIVSKYL